MLTKCISIEIEYVGSNLVQCFGFENVIKHIRPMYYEVTFICSLITAEQFRMSCLVPECHILPHYAWNIVRFPGT